jgi:hypothetical protein
MFIPNFSHDVSPSRNLSPTLASAILCSEIDDANSSYRYDMVHSAQGGAEGTAACFVDCEPAMYASHSHSKTRT